MTCLKYGFGLSVFLVGLLVASKSVQGQAVPGVTEREILIGSCSALEGPSHFLGTETVTGAKAYLDMINDAGGVDGRKLRLISYDDSYDPAKTEACFNRLMEQKVFALAFFVGTPTAVKYLPMAENQRQTAQVGGAIDTVKAAKPEAVVLVGPANTVAPILKQSHAKGWKPLFLTVSFVGTDDLIQEAGSDSDGMVITQVVPPYYLTDYKTVALYRRELTKYFPSAQPNFVSLEGFVDAMVLAEGLKRAGKELTRDGLIRGIESIHEFDLGLGPQLKLNYSSKEHKGFNHVLPTVIRGGRAVPFTDWSTAAPK